MISAGSFFTLPLDSVLRCGQSCAFIYTLTHKCKWTPHFAWDCSHTLMTHRFVGTPGLFPSVYPHGDLSSSSTPPQVCSVLVCLQMISSSLGTSWWPPATRGRSECGMLSHSTGRYNDSICALTKMFVHTVCLYSTTMWHHTVLTCFSVRFKTSFL